jgi:hypothetical protein
MAEDPKTIFKRMTEHTRKVREALTLVSNGESRCFYYPACGDDFIYPLQNFSDRCDTFVFCDWRAGNKELFLETIRAVPDVELGNELSLYPMKDVNELASMEHILADFFPQMPPNLRRFVANPASQQGHYVELRITATGGAEKIVRVFWLAMEGVNIYWKLFARKGIAPRILCIKNWGQSDDEWWTPFGDCWAHLAKVVRDGPSAPELLVARQGDHDWPWTLPVAEFNDWDDQPVIMWAREKPTSRNQQVRKRKPR